MSCIHPVLPAAAGPESYERQRTRLLPAVVRPEKGPDNLQLMCRNIRTLHNFDPPATDGEIQAAALQYVRKVSGSRSPSRANEAAFAVAVADIAAATRVLVDSLVTSAPLKNREAEAAKARARTQNRYK